MKLDYFRYRMDRTIYYTALLYSFFLPLSRAGIVLFSALLILFSILEGNWEEKWHRLRNCKVFLALGLFLIYNLISLIWTDEVVEGLKYIAKYWYFLPMFVLYLSFPKEKSSHLLLSFILGMVVSEIISYGILFQFWTTRHGTPDDPTPFMNHLDYGLFLAFTALLLLSQIIYSKEKREKIITSLFFLTVTGNLFVVGGRIGQLAFFVSLIVVLLYFTRSFWKSLLLGIVIAGGILILPMQLSDTFKNRIQTGISDIERVLNGDYNSSWGMRVGAWEVAGEILKNHYLIGAGNEDNIQILKKITSEKEYLKPLNWYGHFHNQYLQTITALGIVGLILLLNIFFQLAKVPLSDRDRFIQLSFISIFLVGFIAEPFLHKQFSMALWTFVGGYILIQGGSYGRSS
ncbi:MAG TPA: O-antigen ligase domain-containing protein [Campylobacterales bacterium]|nr:O-antigen ligase domain-containing protein [Campylobacterales bacterium]